MGETATRQAAQRADRSPVGQLVEVEALRVGAGAPRDALVEHLLQCDVRHRASRPRTAARSAARAVATAAACSSAVPNPTRISATTGAKWCSAGTNGAGGAMTQAIPGLMVRPRAVGDVARGPQRVRRAVLLDEQHRELHERADLVQPELELGDDAEVAAAAAQRPEQVRVLGRRSRGHGGRRPARPRADSRLSIVSPCSRLSQPHPPPSVSPPTPVWLTVPAGHGEAVLLASRRRARPRVAPPPTRARGRRGRRRRGRSG